jgi:hypothetical protein
VNRVWEALLRMGIEWGGEEVIAVRLRWTAVCARRHENLWKMKNKHMMSWLVAAQSSVQGQEMDQGMTEIAIATAASFEAAVRA